MTVGGDGGQLSTWTEGLQVREAMERIDQDRRGCQMVRARDEKEGDRALLRAWVAVVWVMMSSCWSMLMSCACVASCACCACVIPCSK